MLMSKPIRRGSTGDGVELLHIGTCAGVMPCIFSPLVPLASLAHKHLICLNSRIDNILYASNAYQSGYSWRKASIASHGELPRQAPLPRIPSESLIYLYPPQFCAPWSSQLLTMSLAVVSCRRWVELRSAPYVDQRLKSSKQ